MLNKKDKIKLLFRHRSMEMGGVEKVIISMLNNLNKEKFDITIILNLFQGELRNDIPKHVRLEYLTKGKEDFSKNPLIHKIQLALRKLKLENFRKYPEKIDKILGEKYDVEIASTYRDFESVLNSTNKNSKKIGWFHSDITVPKLQPLVPQILKEIPQFDYFIFGSQQAKDIFLETYPNFELPENQVVLNAIPIEEIKKKAVAFTPDFPEKPVFVSVNRLHSRKGFHKLIDAHAKLLKEGFEHEIYIVGDGEERQNLENQTKNLGVEKSVHFLGTLLNPYPYIKNADYFIMPSESEGWPLVIADTLILQKPIISTNVGGIPEMIEHRKNGYLINYDTDEIYEAMKVFLTDSNVVSKIRENLKDAEKQFDNQKIFDAVEKIIMDLAK